jgi:cytochrome P450
MSHWMLQLDPPDHGRLRGLVVRALTARRVEDMRQRIQQIVDEIIDRLEPQGHMDLIADFAFRLPVTVICDMLGIPDGIARSSSPDRALVAACSTWRRSAEPKLTRAKFLQFGHGRIFPWTVRTAPARAR